MSYGDLDIMVDGEYLKIEAGKPVDVYILTKSEDVQTRFVHYDENVRKYFNCIEKDCEGCVEGLKREMRYMIHVFDRNKGSLKKFEFGPNIAIGIKEIAKVLELDNSDIHQVDLRISRVSEKPVRYQVVQRKMAGPIPQEILDKYNQEAPSV